MIESLKFIQEILEINIKTEKLVGKISGKFRTRSWKNYSYVFE